MAGVDTVTSETVDLESELNVVAGHLNAQHARLVDLAARLAADERTWCGPGVHSLAQYLAWRTGTSTARARQVVDIAERADELPSCMAAFRAGELSLDQVSAIARRAPWWTDDEVCELARSATVQQLNRALGSYPFPDIPHPDSVDPAGAEGERVGAAPADGTACADEPGPDVGPAGAADDRVHAASDSGSATAADPDHPDHADHPGDGDDIAARCLPDPQDHCSFHLGDDGRFRLHLETDALTGSIIETALIEARDALFQGGQADVTWVDAVREVAQRSLDAVASPARRNRFRINIHIDAAGGAVDAVGALIPDAVRRHATCDGTLSPVFVDGAVPVSVGRSQHIVPERTRRLVLLRDQGCAVPGCTQHRFIEVHHIVHWLDGGSTDTANLICLCPHHHRLHHRGRLGVTGDADVPGGVSFTVGGEPMVDSGARPEPPGAAPPPPIGTYRHPEGGRLHTRWLYFNPPPEHRPRAMAARTSESPAARGSTVTSSGSSATPHM